MLDWEPGVDLPVSSTRLLWLGELGIFLRSRYNPNLACWPGTYNVMSVTILFLNRSTAVISGRPIHDCKIWNMASNRPSLGPAQAQRSTSQHIGSMQSAI